MSFMIRRSVALSGAHSRAATASLADYVPPREEPGSCVAVGVQSGTCQPLQGFADCADLAAYLRAVLGLSGTQCMAGAASCSVTECCCGNR